ncbi:MAG: hypothetical protein KJP21_03845 [Bacteroidia bacterium]|nr:hypothetical protein [Bacteroidia bacterium]NNJ55125.1 hypothetical protein [Bacteroidia bacterium]
MKKFLIPIGLIALTAFLFLRNSNSNNDTIDEPTNRHPLGYLYSDAMSAFYFIQSHNYENPLVFNHVGFKIFNDRDSLLYESKMIDKDIQYFNLDWADSLCAFIETDGECLARRSMINPLYTHPLQRWWRNNRNNSLPKSNVVKITESDITGKDMSYQFRFNSSGQISSIATHRKDDQNNSYLFDSTVYSYKNKYLESIVSQLFDEHMELIYSLNSTYNDNLVRTTQNINLPLNKTSKREMYNTYEYNKNQRITKMYSADIWNKNTQNDTTSIAYKENKIWYYSTRKNELRQEYPLLKYEFTLE